VTAAFLLDPRRRTGSCLEPHRVGTPFSHPVVHRSSETDSDSPLVITGSMCRHRLTTRQLWLLMAVACERVERRAMYGGLCTVDGRSVCWTVMTLALRGLIAFDPMPLSQPHLTRRGQDLLRSLAP